MSGVASPTKAVRSFSCAALHGICWTTTRMEGLRRSKSGMSAATRSPSAPRAQNWSCSRTSRRSAQDTNAKCKMQNAKSHRPTFCILHFAFCISVLQPPAREPRPLQPPYHVRIPPHHAPHQPAPVVLDHRHDRSFVDAEVVDVEPADPGDHAAVLELFAAAQGRVEGVEEAVRRI